MSAIYLATEAAESFIKLFILFRLYRSFLYTLGIDNLQGNFKHDFLWSAAGVLLACLCSYIPLLSYNLTFILAVFLCFTERRVYKARHIILFSVSGFYMLCFKYFEFAMYAVSSLFFGGYKAFLGMLLSDGVFRTAVLCAKIMLWYAVSAILCKYLNKVRIPKKSTYTLLVFSCAGCMGFIYLLGGILELYTSVMVRICLFFVFASIAIAFTFYFYMAERREEQKNTELLEMRNSLLTENYKAVSNIYMSNAKLYHDLNNHLNVLYQMLEDNKINDAKAYIEKISRPVTKLSKTAWTGNGLIDAILNSKIEKMREYGMDVDINVEFPRNTDIEPHDLCIILGNLIDNAIEATEKSAIPGSIAICIRKINHFTIIQVSNPYTGNKGEYIGLPATTKGDTKLHGWGLLSVADAVKKYNGTLKCKNENNRFIVTAMLFFEEASGD